MLNVSGCVNRSAEIASEHSRNHEIEERISSLAFFTVDPASFDAQDSTIPCVSAKCPYQNREKHYHCLWVRSQILNLGYRETLVHLGIDADKFIAFLNAIIGRMHRDCISVRRSIPTS